MKHGNMPRRRTLFWDADPETIDPERHARYIIERVLNYGTDEEIRWLVHYYSSAKIREVLAHPRSELKKKTKALWDLVYLQEE